MTTPFVEMSYSKDGGHTWSNWKRRSIGSVGVYQERLRVKFQQLGISRQWAFKIRISSPVRRDILGAVANIEVLNK